MISTAQNYAATVNMASGGRIPSRLSHTAGNMVPQIEVRALPSFARDLRTNQPNNRIVSSIYSVPASEAIDRVHKPLPNVIAGYQQEASCLHAAERRAALRMPTRRGKVMCADGQFRIPGTQNASDDVRERSPAGFKFAYDHQLTTPKCADMMAEGISNGSHGKTPMRVMTRKGKVLSADHVFGASLGDDDGGAARRRSSNAFETTQNHQPAASKTNDLKSQFQQALTRFEAYSARYDPLQRYLCEEDENKDHAGLPAQFEGGHRKDQATQTTFFDEFDEDPIAFQDVPVQELFDEPIVVSKTRYVPVAANPNPPSRRPSLIRRLSDSVKGIFRRPSHVHKRDISKPRNVRDYDPGHQDANALHPDIRARPLDAAQGRAKGFKQDTERKQHTDGMQRSAGSTSNFQRELPLRKFAQEKAGWDDGRYSRVIGARPDQRERAVRRMPAFSLAQRAPEGPREVKVVGDPDRGTLFIDFIRAAETPPNRPECGADHADLKDKDRDTENVLDCNHLTPPLMQDQYSQPELVPEQLNVRNWERAAHPGRKESLRKRVDTSTKSWMPPDRNRDGGKIGFVAVPVPPQPAQVASACDWRMLEDDLSMNDLFDPVEEIIDAYADREWEKGEWEKGEWEKGEWEKGEWEKEEFSRQDPTATRSRPPSNINGINDEDEEPEVLIDTWDRGSHTSWVRRERPNSRIACSDYQRFGQELDENWRNRDEAGRMMERLPQMKAGDVREERFGYI